MIQLYNKQSPISLIKGTNDAHIGLMHHISNRNDTMVLRVADEFKMRPIKCNESLMTSGCD